MWLKVPGRNRSGGHWTCYGLHRDMALAAAEPGARGIYLEKLQEKCRSAGVPCELVYPGSENVRHARAEDYLIEKLNEPATRGTK